MIFPLIKSKIWFRICQSHLGHWRLTSHIEWQLSCFQISALGRLHWFIFRNTTADRVGSMSSSPLSSVNTLTWLGLVRLYRISCFLDISLWIDFTFLNPVYGLVFRWNSVIWFSIGFTDHAHFGNRLVNYCFCLFVTSLFFVLLSNGPWKFIVTTIYRNLGKITTDIRLFGFGFARFDDTSVLIHKLVIWHDWVRFSIVSAVRHHMVQLFCANLLLDTGDKYTYIIELILQLGSLSIIHGGL